jgi:biopolymer transport protein ExbB
VFKKFFVYVVLAIAVLLQAGYAYAEENAPEAVPTAAVEESDAEAAAPATDTSEIILERTIGMESNMLKADGLAIDLVYGTFRRSVELKVSKDPAVEKWGSFIRVAPAYLIEPVDAELRRAIRISVKYDDRIIPPGKVERDVAMVWSADGIEWEVLGGEVLADLNLVEAKVENFGYLAAAVLIGKNSPKADFEIHPPDPTVGREIRFTGQCMDPDGDFISYAWDFDSDGKVDSTDPEVYRRFDTAGDYPIELVCTDGISEDKKVISLDIRSLSFQDYVDKFLELLISAGDWVLYVLFVSAILIIVFIVERSIFFFVKNRFDYGQCSRRFRRGLYDGGIDKGREVLARYDVPEGWILKEALKYADQYSPDTIADIINGEMAAWRKTLDKRLTFLGTLGNNAPFIGLFGTVLGIINAFGELKSGLISPQAIQGEIGEALRATAVGLLVAIPAVIAFNIFSKKVTRISQNVEALGAILIAYLKENGPHGRGNGYDADLPTDAKE